MNIYIASNNQGKLQELSKCFPKYTILSQSNIENFLKIKININENGKTFSENAIIKVKALKSVLHDYLKKEDIIIADDSGILIPSLPGFLGVYTKRQMEEWCKRQNGPVTENDFYNCISSITPLPNICIFEVSIAVITYNNCKTYTQKLEGTLAKKCRGNNGFGFDPIFEINHKTLAEMSSYEKSLLNPRIQAIKKLKKDLSIQKK